MGCWEYPFQPLHFRNGVTEVQTGPVSSPWARSEAVAKPEPGLLIPSPFPHDL